MSLPPHVSVVAVAQGSEAWYAARLGRATASEAACVLARLKGTGEAATRRNYRVQLVLERITGRPQGNGFFSADMQRGTDLEPVARAAYEARTGAIVRQTGFLAHQTLAAGASLDGDLDHFAGIVEIKCPKAATHLDTLRTRTPGEYRAQIMAQLWLSGAAWCDYVSYHPEFPPPLDLCVVRVMRDEDAITAYVLALILFLEEVDQGEAEVRQMLAAGGER